VSGGEGEERAGRAKVAYVPGGSAEVGIDEDIPLYPGINRISVIARDDTHMTSSSVIYVYRRTPGDPVSNAP
jgi:hypothetical protein